MSQNAVRAAGIAALNAWYKEIGLVSFIEGEVIFGALSTENPNLRTEVWTKYVIVIKLFLANSLKILLVKLRTCDPEF